MEKEIGRIKKNDTTDIIVRVDEYKGKKGVTIREFITSDRYTGFTKAGTRIGPEDFLKFREMINSIDYNELSSPAVEVKPAETKSAESQQTLEKSKKERKPRKPKKQPVVEEPVAEEPVEEESKEVDESELEKE